MRVARLRQPGQDAVGRGLRPLQQPHRQLVALGPLGQLAGLQGGGRQDVPGQFLPRLEGRAGTPAVPSGQRARVGPGGLVVVGDAADGQQALRAVRVGVRGPEVVEQELAVGHGGDGELLQHQTAGPVAGQGGPRQPRQPQVRRQVDDLGVRGQCLAELGPGQRPHPGRQVG